MAEPPGTEHMCRIAAEVGVPVLLNGERWLVAPRESAASTGSEAGPVVSLGGPTLARVKGDITRLEVDVIVNAANSSLLGGGGVDGAIHRAAGPALLEACRAVRARQGSCGTGEAVLTGAGDLAATHVVHTVGPVWDPADPGRADGLLARCYAESLDLAAGVGARSVAFPCISTGVYRYPADRAARVAVAAVAEWLGGTPSSVEEVLFVAFDDGNAAAIDGAIAELPGPGAMRTERLSLVPWRPGDAPELRALLDANDAHLRPWIPFMRHEPRDLAGTQGVIDDCAASFAKGEHLRFGIRTLAGDELVGEAMLIDRGEPGCKELGYWLARSATGRGYATEASAALLDLAFDRLALPRIEIVCDLENGPSIRVAERLGGRLEREFEEEEDGKTCRCGVFVVTRGS